MSIDGRARIGDTGHGALLGILLPQTLNRVPDGAKELRAGLLEFAPRRNVILLNIDIVPTDQAVHWGIVQLDIQNSSSVIFYGIFYGRDGNNEDERYCVQTRIATTKDGENLEYDMLEKIHTRVGRKRTLE